MVADTLSAPMISYAQNAEDVVLRRVFSDVEEGFYVDVGASSPVDDSVTLHFYERGWRGVNVEPDPVDFADLAAARPRDVNLHAAVGTGAQPLRFLSSGVRGHGTVASSGDGVEVAQISLEEIFTSHAPASGVHFLKVDVEGSERDVLASGGFDRVRPQIVLVEAVDPFGVANHQDWEPRLLDAGYRFGLFDGLNRFYCREEEAERLLPRLLAPANVLDNWRPEREVRVQRALEGRIARAAHDAEVARREHEHTRQELAALAVRLAALEGSTSWRLTAGLRDASRFLKLLRRETEN